MSEQTGNPMVYVGTNRKQFGHLIPPDVLEKCTEVRCGKCNAPTLFISRTLRITREALANANRILQTAGKPQRELHLVCNQCPPEKIDTSFEIFDPDIEKRMLKHKAEMN